MKKIFLFISILLFPIFIFAKEYEVEDINMKLDVRTDYIVFTRNNLDNNTDLVKLNIPQEYLENLMKTNNIYYDIIKNDVSYEILVVVPNTKLQFNNLSNATDTMLNDLKNELVKKTGATVSSVYKAKNNYIVVDYYDANTKYYIVNYYTVVNARGYNIQLQKRSEITNDERQDLKDIIDSINIKVLDEYKEESKEMQKNIEKYDKKPFDYKNIIWGAVIGAAVGLISYVIGIFIKKKKSSV